MSNRFDAVVKEVELLVAESAQLASEGPHFQIDHGLWTPGTLCQAGEEISAVWLIHRSRRYQLRLPLALRIVFDLMARRRWQFQSALQIERARQSDEFYASHGANAAMSRQQTRKISHSGVKQYVSRIRRALREAFEESGLNLDPSEVLVSEAMQGNAVGYRLKATVIWSHTE